MSKNTIDPTLLAFMESQNSVVNLNTQEKQLPAVESNSKVLEGELILADETALSDKLDKNAGRYSSIMDKLLKTQRMTDAAELGDSMNELITTAKGLDPEKLGKGGFIGKLKNMFGNAKEHFERETDTVLARIDTLSLEVNKNITAQIQVKKDFDLLLVENNNLYKTYQQDLVDFQKELEKVEHYKTVYDKDDAKIFQLKSYGDRLTFFIENIQNSLISTKIMGEEIQNSLGSVTKIIDAIRSSEKDLINNWKLALNIYTRNKTQQQGIDLVDNMRKANDDALLAQGKLNNEVTLGATRLQQSTNQKLETLELLTNKLTETAEAVKKLEAEGKTVRAENEKRRKNISATLDTLGRV